MSKLFFFLLVASLSLSVAATPAQAAVIISEVFPYSLVTNEWVELYNSGSEPISLANWYLEDFLTVPSLLHTFPSTASIPAQSYLTIEFTNQLNNNGDGVVLKNSVDQIIDEMHYGYAAREVSWAKIDGVFIQASPTKNAANTSPSPAPTPSPSPSPTTSPTPSPSPLPSPSPSVSPSPSPNPSPTPTPIFDPYDILLSEIMACPSNGGPEWLELYNPTDQSMSLTNWRVTDWAGNSRTFDVTLLPQSYTAITWLSSMLNNTGDSLFLEAANGDIIASANFSGCSSNQSFVWINNQWQLTQLPTENQPNQLSPQPTPSPSPSPSPSPTTSPTPSATPKSSPKPSASPSNSPAASPSPSSYLLNNIGSVLGATTRLVSDGSPTTGFDQRPVIDLISAFPASYAAELNLKASPTQNPFTDPSQVVTIKPSKVSFWAAISVILGGGIIAISSAYLLYDHYQSSLTRSLA